MFEYMCVIVCMCLVSLCVHEVLYVLGYVCMCAFYDIVNV